MTDYTALYDEDADEDAVLACYQSLVNSGQAWKLEGHVGRTAMSLLDARLIALGEEGHTDYWGNYVPSRYEVAPGTKGAPEFAHAAT